MNIVSPKLDYLLGSSVPTLSPRLNVGLPMIAVSPRQPPQPYLRHGCGPSLHLGDNPIGFHTPARSHRGATLRPNGVFAMYYVENKQSRVAACCDLPGDGFSTTAPYYVDNQQPAIHPHAWLHRGATYDHACPVAPRRDPTTAPYYVDNQQPALHPHACPVAPRRDPTTEWCFLRCIMLRISRVGSRLAATYQAMVLYMVLSTVATFAIYQFILYFCSLKCK